jgi:hypothetical protein
VIMRAGAGFSTASIAADDGPTSNGAPLTVALEDLRSYAISIGELGCGLALRAIATPVIAAPIPQHRVAGANDSDAPGDQSANGI